jgi:hypothetical protein
MKNIEKKVKHIEQVHASIYSKTFNRDLLAGKKSLLRINKKQIEKIDKERKELIKERADLLEEARAYERILAI